MADKILNAYAAGFTPGHIARALHVPVVCVANTIRQARRAADPRAAEPFPNDATAKRLRARVSYGNWRGAEAWVLDADAIGAWSLDEAGIALPKPDSAE